jgi:hypothetical protein
VPRFPTQKPATPADGFAFVKFREISSQKKLRVFCVCVCQNLFFSSRLDGRVGVHVVKAIEAVLAL